MALSASARPWKPAPSALAQDYAQILHDRGNGNIVMIWWLVPLTVPPSPQVRELLDQYVIIGVVHARASNAGTMSFDPVDTLQAQDANGRQLKLIAENDLPPAMTGALAGLQAAL